MTRTRIVSFAVASIVGFAWAGSAEALPMFARKYNMDCQGCHDAPAFPRLNSVGYKFRRAGFRMPEEIGKEETQEFNVTNYFAALANIDYSLSQTEDKTSGTTEKSSANSIDASEIAVYPLTGSFGKYWASVVELGFAPDATPEVGNAFLRGVHGNEDLWFEARAGVFHALEGFGASDLSLGVTSPFLMMNTASKNQDTLVSLMGSNLAGAEVGVEWKDTSLSVLVHNGFHPETGADGIGAVASTRDTDTRKDVHVFANQIFGNSSGVSLLYMHGDAPLPVDPAGFAGGTNTATFYDYYDRFAAFGSFGTKRFEALAGLEAGMDDALDPVTGARSRFRSQGAFLEGDVAVTPSVAAYCRLDMFDPAVDVKTDEMTGVVVGGSFHKGGLSLRPEVWYTRTRSTLGDRTEAAGVLHAVVGF